MLQSFPEHSLSQHWRTPRSKLFAVATARDTAAQLVAASVRAGDVWPTDLFVL